MTTDLIGSLPPTVERPALSVDVVIFRLYAGDLQTLLIKRAVAPYRDSWAIPGGFVQYGESPLDAARRELESEAGLTEVFLEQLYTFGEAGRDPRGHVVTIAYFALLPSPAAGSIQAGSDASEAAWHSIYHPPTLAFDHTQILDYALQRLRYKLEYSAVGFRLLPAEFTLSELQSAYELVLGEKLDKRNFRRRLLEANVLVATEQYRNKGEGRPALLYRYREDADPEIKARRLFP
jgi:8-oxo-dGTP diphosphatase